MASTGRGKPTLSGLLMGGYSPGRSTFFSKQLAAPDQARKTLAETWFFGTSTRAIPKLWNGSSWINITPRTGQTYTVSNVSTDRTYDANSTSTDELADVLGTLLTDLRNIGIIE